MKKKSIFVLTLAIGIVLLEGCNKTPTMILEGTKVSINYVGTLEDGTIFENETKTITVGSGNTILGIEKALIGQKSGDKLSIDVNPEDAYAYKYNANNQQRISSYIFEQLEISPDIGKIVTLDETTGKVLAHEQDSGGNTIIVLDVNPPQTRQKLHYEIDILEIIK